MRRVRIATPSVVTRRLVRVGPARRASELVAPAPGRGARRGASSTGAHAGARGRQRASAGSSTDPGHRVVLAVLPGGRPAASAGGEAPSGWSSASTRCPSCSGNAAGHGRHVRRAPRAPAARRRARALLAAAAAYARGERRGHVVAAVDRARGRRQRFFARMGFAPLTTRRIARVDSLGAVAGGLAAHAPARASSAGVARARPPALRPASAWRSQPLTARLDASVAAGSCRSAGRWRSCRPSSSVTSMRKVDSVRPRRTGVQTAVTDAGGRRPQVAGVELDADDLLLGAGADAAATEPMVSTRAQVAPPCSRPNGCSLPVDRHRGDEPVRGEVDDLDAELVVQRAAACCRAASRVGEWSPRHRSQPAGGADVGARN